MTRKLFLTAFALFAVCCLATPGLALEKKSAHYDPDNADDWSSGATCLISYYNICTGWVWVLGFNDTDVENDKYQIGVNVLGETETSALVQSRIRYWSGAPTGRGYTGTIAVYAADANGCPAGPPLASQRFLPPFIAPGNGFYTQNWSGVPLPSSFILAVTVPGDVNGSGNPLGFGTDYGTTGPTGPDACGTCYPAGRQSHSYLWMDSGGTYCPGQTLVPLVPQNCEVELLWDLTFNCTVSVDDASWGTIKALYR